MFEIRAYSTEVQEKKINFQWTTAGLEKFENYLGSFIAQRNFLYCNLSVEVSRRMHRWQGTLVQLVAVEIDMLLLHYSVLIY